MRDVMQRALLVGALAAGSFAPAVCAARQAAPPDSTTAATTPEQTSLDAIGMTFENARFLGAAERVPALQQASQSVDAILKTKLDDERRAAAFLLSSEIQFALGDGRAAGDAARKALGTKDTGPFADDAAFLVIRAMEKDGKDADAAREWPRWMKRFPTSSLTGEAQLAAAANALRRDHAADAEKMIATLLATRPWMANDSRVALVKGLALLRDDKPSEAYAALDPASPSAAVSYARALCLSAQGSLLKAAALFQDAGERYPDSPLRDAALFAKANMFFRAKDYRSASEEFARVADRIQDPSLKAESELRSAGSKFVAGDVDGSLGTLRDLVTKYSGTDVAARAQYLVGEALVAQGKDEEAIVELNRVLSTYFQHAVAASAQYRVARCLDRLGRHGDATGAYEAVVAGYPLAHESPAAAYLAGVGLLGNGKPIPAARYFQLVLDRYAPRGDSSTMVVFAEPQDQELVESALCMLEMAYHQAGDLGQLSGAPHLLLQRLPPSRSIWRAYAVLIDADASASQGRYAESQIALEHLRHDFPDKAVATDATKLLAWTYARQGRDSTAIATEEELLARPGLVNDDATMASALLDIAHARFNQKRYSAAAAAYEDYLHRFPAASGHLTALYQAGLCYLRLDRAGDAVDRWESIVADSADAALAERAWARLGDVYFQAEKYEKAKHAYQGLLEHFASSSAASLATLRLAQCEYNAGHDEAALAGFSQTIAGYPGTPAAREAQRGQERALYRLSQSPNATETLARLVEQYPTSAFAADAQFQAARRLYQDKRYAEAAEGFRQVVSRFPGYSAADQAQFLMADAYQQAGSLDDARRAYEQFATFFPHSELGPTVDFRTGLLQFQAKDYMNAAVTFTRVLGESASAEVRSAALYNRALCQRQIGTPDDTRADLERYRREFPRDSRAADVTFQTADLEESQGHNQDAERDFLTARDMSPRADLAVQIDFRLGRLHESMNQQERAVHDYERAAASPRRANPYRLSALARIASIYETRHWYTRALALYRDIAQNATDRELLAAANGRASEIEASLHHRHGSAHN